ncbi:fumarate hydratase C-terminal domain-containing protein [Candidatus Bathyarchaeota archaeon]|nr:fumarate hydratase C-terminal domain-containing protein [Candidatus Bathyarchaeota archaeon]
MSTYKLKTPISEEAVRNLHVGDIIYISGTILTARDQAHQRAVNFHNQGKPLPLNLEGMVIFHSGPLVQRKDRKWEIGAAGPTTSSRMEPFQAEFIEAFKPRIIIGKGGMGARTAEALKKFGAVYCEFTGGAAVLAARSVRHVKDVKWLNLGLPEALWLLEVEEFGPLFVTMDSHGGNLYNQIAEKVEQAKLIAYKKLGIIF